MTLDPDVEALIATTMREKGISFKEAVNQAIRAGLASGNQGRFHQQTFDMGFRPEINYDRALQLAAAFEDEELRHKLALGK